MRVVVQRVKNASVSIDQTVVGKIEKGLLVLLGIRPDDKDSDIEFMTEKLLNLRIFSDDHDKMNLSLLDIQGELLIVSQFTLYGDCRKGRRPSFIDAARPEIAIPLYERFIARARLSGLKIETGQFGAMMDVALVNDGPVTIILDSPS